MIIFYLKEGEEVLVRKIGVMMIIIDGFDIDAVLISLNI